ncbi:DUF1120 domain-containing protein [Pseudomonas sp. SDO5271_S396]
MKDSLIALAGVLLIAHGTLALAASSVDLTVKGAITPSACAPSLSNGGNVDYGKISAKDLKPIGYTDLPKFTFQLSVSCEAATLFAVIPKNNRPALPYMGNPSVYGLGVVNGDELVGVYFLDVENIQADGNNVHPLKSADNGQSWNLIPPGFPWEPETFTGFGKNVSGVLAPVQMQELALDLIVWPLISPVDGLTLTGSVPLDGSATLELRYL